MRYRVSNETWYLGDDLKIVFDILNLFMAFTLKIFHYFCKNNTFKTDCRMKAVNFFKGQKRSSNSFVIFCGTSCRMKDKDWMFVFTLHILPSPTHLHCLTRIYHPSHLNAGAMPNLFYVNWYCETHNMLNRKTTVMISQSLMNMKQYNVWFFKLHVKLFAFKTTIQ